MTDARKVDRILALRDSVGRLETEAVRAEARAESSSHRLEEITAELRANGLDPDGDVVAQLDAMAEALRTDIEAAAAVMAALNKEVG